MEKIHVKTAVIIALIATVLGSLVAPSLVTAQTGIMAGTASGVFSKIHGDDPVLLSTLMEPIMSINLPFIGQSLYYKVECDGYLSSGEAVCRFAIGADSPNEDPYTWRYYGDTGVDTHTNMGIHTERVYRLGPGAHSFHFLGMIYGEGVYPHALVNRMSLTVTVYTHGSLEEPVAEFEADIDSAKPHEP
jgi:hypothetical protein